MRTCRSRDQAEALIGANLSWADLYQANLRGANLREADLRGANEVTNEQLSAARSLEGAIMRNGQKYEDWLKDKKAREEGG